MSTSNGSSANGAAAQQEKVRVAIIGVGNCASSLRPGRRTTTATPTDDDSPRPDARRPRRLPRPRHRVHGRLRHRPDKVGKDLGEAIWSPARTTRSSFAEVPRTWACRSQRGMTHDGLGKYLSQMITKAPGPTADIVGILRDTHTDVVVSYLPVGSEQATKWYVEQVLEAGCALRQLHPGLHRPRATTGSALPEGGPADHRRRHQVARSARRSCTAS